MIIIDADIYRYKLQYLRTVMIIIIYSGKYVISSIIHFNYSETKKAKRVTTTKNKIGRFRQIFF